MEKKKKTEWMHEKSVTFVTNRQTQLNLNMDGRTIKSMEFSETVN